MNNIKKIITNSCKRIAPTWSLKNMVAVNPYMGFAHSSFEETAKDFTERGNIKLTMPLSFYLDQLERNVISESDVVKALEKFGVKITSYDYFIQDTKRLSKREKYLDWTGSCLVDIASDLMSKDWCQLMVETVSKWASTHFDEGVAIWNSNDTSTDVFTSWKAYAKIDLTPEIMGLKGFRKSVKELPDNYEEFVSIFLNQIKIEEDHVEAYLHAMLLKIIGWSSYVSGIDFNNKVYSGSTKNTEAFLAILLAWENYFYNSSNEKIKSVWYEQMHKNHEKNKLLLDITEMSIVLQEAFDISTQKQLINDFKNHSVSEKPSKTKAQMVFCIDVRSEVYRRNLEQIDTEIETIGFAGFFGFPIKYTPIADTSGKNQCPVLLPASIEVNETYQDHPKAWIKRVSKNQIQKSWKQFKSGAITSFGFVSPLGLLFLPKIISDSFGWTRTVDDPKTNGLKKQRENGLMLDLSQISLEEKTQMAAGALSGMGIKDKLAPFVLITGHGASSVNNPHASGLECGACGGHSGEMNALTAQLILNDKAVRKELQKMSINIPEATLFVACLHDTTTDEISVVNEKLIPENSKACFQEIMTALDLASEKTRIERAKRLNIQSDINENIIKRAADWSQVRPEWGLAGCNAFVIANRNKTQGLDLKGKAFLHSYEWQNDDDFTLLESIMTAPMIVTSWINLQYYASTTDNRTFGAGNKTINNVTAGIGVIEGSDGDLRIGLPLQSIHNGEEFEHLPQKLNVVIEAPIKAINKVLVKHNDIRQLFDNSWIQLHRLDELGNISHTYNSNLKWNENQFDKVPKTQKEYQTV